MQQHGDMDETPCTQLRSSVTATNGVGPYCIEAAACLTTMLLLMWRNDLFTS